VSFAAITLRVASQRMFIVVRAYSVIDSVRKLLDTSSMRRAWRCCCCCCSGQCYQEKRTRCENVTSPSENTNIPFRSRHRYITTFQSACQPFHSLPVRCEHAVGLLPSSKNVCYVVEYRELCLQQLPDLQLSSRRRHRTPISHLQSTILQ
jgi:hypothetical protein